MTVLGSINSQYVCVMVRGEWPKVAGSNAKVTQGNLGGYVVNLFVL